MSKFFASLRTPQCTATKILIGSMQNYFITFSNSYRFLQLNLCSSQVLSGTIVEPDNRDPKDVQNEVFTYMKCIDGIWDHVAVYPSGLRQSGTNITILIMDKLEVHVNNLNYFVPFLPNILYDNVTA